MWNGKKKAVTFSYDDGCSQDIRLIEILNRYGLRATFNLNSGLLGTACEASKDGKKADLIRPPREKIAEIYKDHEIAVHTLTHRRLPLLSDEEVVKEVEEDRRTLSEIAGYEVVGMAYPCGGWQNSDRVERLIRANTGIKYARVVGSSFSTAAQTNLFRFHPTVFHLNFEENVPMFDDFISSDEEGVFYIWGHSYEFDCLDKWEEFEEFCKYISGRKDVFYGTNSEVLLQ